MQSSDEAATFGCITILALSAVSVFSCAGINTSPGEGEKIGQIVKISHVGIINKTYEAELVRGGLVDGSGTVGGQTFHFTIRDPEMVVKAKEHMRKQTETRLRYVVEGLYLQWNSESGGRFAVELSSCSTNTN